MISEHEILHDNLSHPPSAKVKAAKRWFDTWVLPYMYGLNFQYITAGNEVVPGDLAQYVLPATQNMQSVIRQYEYTGIRVSTVVGTTTLRSSNPPQAVHSPMKLKPTWLES